MLKVIKGTSDKWNHFLCPLPPVPFQSNGGCHESDNGYSDNFITFCTSVWDSIAAFDLYEQFDESLAETTITKFVRRKDAKAQRKKYLRLCVFA